ncbi:MAG: hypothetical protein AB7T32_03185 [Dehalococcoidia bacterium]
MDLHLLTRWAARIGMLAAVIAVFAAGSLLLSSRTAAADVCTDSAIAFGYNDSDSDSCDTWPVINDNGARAENTSSPWSVGFALARADVDNATLGGPTYAWSFNNGTILGAALSRNSVDASNVSGVDVFGPEGSAYAISQNTDSKLVLAGASNRVQVSNVDTSTDAFLGNVFANSENTRCYMCAGLAFNNVTVDGVSSTYGAVSGGSIYARTLNEDAVFSKAVAYNRVNIVNVDAYGNILTGDESGNGSYAVAENLGGEIENGDCVHCFAAAYNSLDIVDVNVPYGDFMEAARAVGRNEYSSGSSAIGINQASFSNVQVNSGDGLQQTYGYAFNTWSPDSTAKAVNLVNVQGQDGGVSVGSISYGSLWSEANNNNCYECTAKSYNNIDLTGEVTAAGSIFGGGASALALNEGPQAIGFGENTAVASNTVKVEGIVSAGGYYPDSVGAQDLSGDIITNSVYSYAHNYTGGQESGYCYECVALADNFLKISDSSSGGSLVATDVYAMAENYNSDEVLAKAKNKVIIKDTSASYSVIEDPESYTGSVFAFSTNRYCYECEARSDNLVVIDNNTTGGTVLNGHAYAWAENNIDDSYILAADVEEEEGNQNTAVAYNTLIIADNDFSAPAAFANGGSIVDANVYSCASNNVGGGACGGRCVVRICDESASVQGVYDGNCINCHATADNYVKVTGGSTINPIGTTENSGVGIYAHAENTAQGAQEMVGVCDTCLAKAVNVVNAENGSNVNGQTSSTAINQNSENAAAAAGNVLNLNNSSGQATAKATNTYAENSAAVAGNLTSATNGGTVESTVTASNTNTNGALALGLGQTSASNGGEASSDTSAIVGNTASGTNSGVAIAASTTNADNGNASTTTTADLSNDGSSSGVAYSVSYDANGNVAVAVVATNNGDGVAVAYTNATNASATADAQAEGGTTGGDISFQTGDPNASTSVSP